MYAWNASDWAIESDLPELIKLQEVNLDDICGEVSSLVAKYPLDFESTINLLKKFGNGKMLYIDTYQLKEQLLLAQVNTTFSPYIETNGTKSFYNIYTQDILPEPINWWPEHPTDTKYQKRCLCFDSHAYACPLTAKASSFVQIIANSTFKLRYLFLHSLSIPFTNFALEDFVMTVHLTRHTNLSWVRVNLCTLA